MNWADLTREQRAEAIRAGVAADKSGLTIGRELGVSRNVIIGWAHRNNIPLRRSLCVGAGAKHHKQGRKSAAKKVDPFTGRQRATRAYDSRKPVEAPRPNVVRPLPEKPTTPPVLFRGRRMGFECAYIDGDPKHPLAVCCGAPVDGLTEWCPWHLQIVAPWSGKASTRAA